LALDANTTYDPDTPGSPHPLQYKEGIPTFDKKHDAKLSTLIATCNLVDPLAKQHSSRPFPASHIRGSERIDFILVSQTIEKAVTASGCLSFYSLFNSDHRGYYVDFDAKILFSDPVYEIAPRSHRKLRLHDPKLIDKYRTFLHHQLEVHKIQEKLTALKEHAAKATWTSAHTDQYNTLDDITTAAMLSAENQLSRSHSVKFDWSPKLERAVQAQRYWYLRLKQCKGIMISPSRLGFHHREADINSDTTSTLTEVVTSLSAATTTLRTYQKDHTNLRVSYLEELAEAIILHQSPNLSFNSMESIRCDRVEKEIWQLIKRETSRKTFRKISRLLSPTQNKGLSRINILDARATNPSFGNPKDPKTWQGPWTSITNPTEIAQIVTKIKSQQYHQAHNTPFGSGPVVPW